MTDPIIGIDLGTTNSEVAVLENGRVRVLEIEPGQQVLPSFVGLDDAGELLVGEPARNQYMLYPERTVKSIKRRMGTDESVVLGDTAYRPQEIAAAILKQLKRVAEAYLGQAVHRAVITVPAYFNDAQRRATAEAGEIAGLEVVRMINEPTAAALAYEGEHPEGKTLLVYDLGGGTFDVSVVRVQQGVVEVVASHGDNHLGGDDFDQHLLDHLSDRLATAHGFDPSSDRRALARLNRAAEAAKRALSDVATTRLEEEYLGEVDGRPIHLDDELDRSAFEAMIEAHLDDTMEALHSALRDAELAASAVDEILLVGGSTRIPRIQERLTAEFGFPPRREIDPDLCVATGAAVQAGLIGGERVSTVLVDVTPYNFGTSALGEVNGEFTNDRFVPIIRKNTPIPVTKEEMFYTVQPGQEKVDVHIYQGDQPYGKDNTLVGRFMVEGLDRRAPEHSPIVLRLALDLNGVLQVTAREKATGLEKSITIDNAMGEADAEQIQAARERLEALLPDEAEVPGAADGAQAPPSDRLDTLIERGEGLLETATGEDREDLVDLLEQAKEARTASDAGAREAAAESLADLLYYLEG